MPLPRMTPVRSWCSAARARSALVLGKRLIHSDSTEDSRPVLERAGLVKVSTTTPYLWGAGE
jgi:hypothetical protein